MESCDDRLLIGRAAARVGTRKVIGLVPDGGAEGQERIVGRPRSGDRPDRHARSVVKRRFWRRAIGREKKFRLLQNTLGDLRRRSRG